MYNVRIDYYIASGKIDAQVREVLGGLTEDVELFGVGIDDQELPEDYKIVGYGSRETLLICENGKILDSEDMERKENISTIMCDTPYSEEFIEKNYDDIIIQDALNSYDWEVIYDRLDELSQRDNNELLYLKSKYFNMKVICAAAGVNYETYRGWKNKGFKMGEKKIIALLNTMRKVAQ